MPGGPLGKTLVKKLEAVKEKHAAPKTVHMVLRNVLFGYFRKSVREF